MFTKLYQIIRYFAVKIKEDDVNAYSAQAAFFLIISFFPFVMFLLTLLNYLPLNFPSIISEIYRIFPENVDVFLENLLTEMLEASNGTLLSVTAVAALWSASRGFYAIVNGLNEIYSLNTRRNFLVTRILAFIYTLFFAIILIFVLIIFVFGNQLTVHLTAHIPFIKDIALLVISLRTLVGLVFLILFFTVMFMAVPERKSGFFAELPGAILTSAGWLGFSYLYSFYIDNFSNYSATYGSLTAIVLCMIWVYCCMNIMFVGAELNKALSNPEVHKTLADFVHFRKHSRHQ